MKTFASAPINQNQEVKDAIMSRLKHQIEQKEEFLKRPNGIHPLPRLSQNEQDNHSMESDYARSLNATHRHSTIHELTEIQNTRSALREQFFTNSNSLQVMENNYKTSPNSSFLMHDYSKENHKLTTDKESQLKNSRLQIVLERTKQFETGHPLSPDGIDRTSLYKSELSRMSTKPSTTSVASKCQAIESRLKPKISSKCLSEEMMKEEDIKYEDDMIRSVSMEPIKECDKSLEKNSVLLEKEKERPRPVRENSYLTAVRSSTEPQSFLRQKSPKKSFNLDESDRKTRRSSYLKATTLEDDELNLSNIAQQIEESNENSSQQR